MKYEYKIEFETEHPEWIQNLINTITQVLRDHLSDRCTKIKTTFTYLEDKDNDAKLNGSI